MIKLQVVFQRKGAASELILSGNFFTFEVQGLPLVSEPMLYFDLYVEGLERCCLTEPGLNPNLMSFLVVLGLLKFELVAAIEAIVLIKASKVLFLQQSQH